MRVFYCNDYLLASWSNWSNLNVVCRRFNELLIRCFTRCIVMIFPCSCPSSPGFLCFPPRWKSNKSNPRKRPDCLECSFATGLCGILAKPWQRRRNKCSVMRRTTREHDAKRVKMRDLFRKRNASGMCTI